MGQVFSTLLGFIGYAAEKDPKPIVRLNPYEDERIPNSLRYTPLDKLRRSQQTLEGSGVEDDDSKPATENREERVVLVATGSFCPVHKMHVRMFDIARAHLASQGLNVVGGFLSPSHDMHVQAKLGDRYISAQDRVNMCELAVSDSDWLAVSSWECSQPHFVSFDEVTLNIQGFLNQQMPQFRWRCFFLCGADLVFRCRLFLGAEEFGVVGVGRPEFMNKLRERMQEIHDFNQEREESQQVQFNRFGNFFMVEESDDIEDCSSTLIRQRIEEGQSVDDLTFPAVADYLRCMPKSTLSG